MKCATGLSTATIENELHSLLMMKCILELYSLHVEFYKWSSSYYISWYDLWINLQFLGLFGDVQSIKKAKDRHARLFLRHRRPSESRKRNADDLLTSDKAKIAKSYSGVPSTAPSAYPNAQHQWPSGYGSQTQPWPQATQTTGQAYNPAYAQQVCL